MVAALMLERRFLGTESDSNVYGLAMKRTLKWLAKNQNCETMLNEDDYGPVVCIFSVG
jgi:hypothetical protein